MAKMSRGAHFRSSSTTLSTILPTIVTTLGLTLTLAGCSASSDDGSAATGPGAEETTKQPVTAKRSTESSGPLISAPSDESTEEATEAQTPTSTPTPQPEASGEVSRSMFVGFDARNGGAEATLLRLGDVRIDPDGHVEIRPTPAVNPRTGELVSPNWTYRSTLEAVEVDGTDRLEVNRPRGFELDETTAHQEWNEDLVVHYDRKNGGLKQSIDCGATCSGGDTVAMRWSVPHDFELRAGDDGQIEVWGQGRHLFSWSGLIVEDAEGTSLTASMKVVNGDLVYEIDADGAAMPLHVDPLATMPDQDPEAPNNDGTLFGHTVNGAGDVDDDGYADVIVAQVFYDAPNSPGSDNGRALLFYGSASGINKTADWTSTGQTTQEFWGIGAGAGDINGDQIDDLIISGYQWKDPNVAQNNNYGRVGVFLGASMPWPATKSADQLLPGGQHEAKFGFSVDGADLNCDGFSDVIVGEPGFDGASGSNAGRATVYFGQTTMPMGGGSQDPVQTMNPWVVEGDQATAQLGHSVANAGDLDDDMNDCEDLAFSARTRNSRGSVFVFLAPISGGSEQLSNADTTLDQVTGTNRFGEDVIGAGDVDGDGHDDLAVGAPGSQSGRGFTFVYSGNSTGLQTNNPWRAPGSNSSQFGWDLGSGDVNGDGLSDLLVGAYNAAENPGSSSPTRGGAAHLFLGRSTTGLTQTPAWSEYLKEAGAAYGWSVAIVGDLNGQANMVEYEDVAVGSISASGSGGSNAGKVFVYHGRPTCFINGDFYSDGEANPSNPCEVCDVATSRTQWSNAPANTTCDDGDACTVMDQCQMGTCQGQTKDCDDGLSCTSDSCNSDNGGSCEHTVTTGCLIDGNTCVAAGDAQPGSPCMVCDPNQSTTSYVAASPGASCDDGVFCNGVDTCDAQGQCQSAGQRDCRAWMIEQDREDEATCATAFTCLESVDQCQVDSTQADGTNCSDGDMCTSGDRCVQGVCTPMNTKTCPSNTAPCTENVCNPDTGMCESSQLPDNTTCDNGNDCEKSACQGGTCQKTGDVDCEDNNPCTSDSCQPMGGCQNDPVMDGTTVGMAECNMDNNLLQAAVCMGGMPQMRQVQDCGNYKCTTDPMPQCPESCESDDDCKADNFCFDLPDDQEMNDDKECHPNRVPTADAGPDQGGFARGDRVTLDGTQSSDPDQGDMLTYQWELVGAECPAMGETADVDRLRQAINGQAMWDATAANPTFRAPATDCENETLTFELVVNDGEFDSEADQTTVSYGECEQSPSAVIGGSPASAQWGDTITLDGSQSQAGCGPTLEYSWSYTPQAPTLQTTEQDGGQLQVSLPDVCRETNTTYTFSLTVFDGVQNSEPFQRELFVPANGPCEADTGPDAGPDAGPDVGPDTGQADTGTTGDAGPQADTSLPTDDLEGSSCFCGAAGDNPDSVPGSFVVMLLAGGLMWRRRRA